MHSLKWTVKAWWWKKWHPLVRIGWLVSRRWTSGFGPAVGVGLIGAGLVFRSRKTIHLFNATIPAGEEVTIRVVRNGRTVGTG